LPSGDGLTSSGTLGRYCDLLGDIQAHEAGAPTGPAVDVRA